MNCPECDSMLYQGMCSCGFKVPPISTIEIKRPDTKETNSPLAIKEELKNVALTGKPYAEFCIDYAKKILRGEKC
jgi:hypothetical protein